MEKIIHYVLLGNAALVVAYVCTVILERTAIAFNLRTAYRLRLHLAVAALCTASLPLVLTPIMPIFASLFGTTGTDLIVAQFLKGNISLSAVQITDALSAKNTLLAYLFDGTSAISKLLLLSFVLAVSLRVVYIGINIAKIRKHINDSVVYFRTRRVVVSISHKTIVPYSTRGLFEYHIVIPESLISDPHSFRIALGHEAQHIRQGDVDWEILLTLASPLFALNPAFWLISDRIRRFREYTCDAAFLKKPGIEARDYCLLLLEFASKLKNDRLIRSNSTQVVSVQLCGQDGWFSRDKKCTLRKRIIALSQGSTFIDKGLARYINLAPAILLLFIVGSGVFIAAKPADWSHDRLMLSTVANLERLDKINGIGVAPLR